LILEDAENGLSARMRRMIAELYDLFLDLKQPIGFFDKEVYIVLNSLKTVSILLK
jgi:transposase